MSTSMYLLMKDIFASFVAVQFLLPVILAIEWEFDKFLFKGFVMLFTASFFGLLMYLVLVYLGVNDGIVSYGGRDMSMRLGLSIGFIFGGCFVYYITKPLFYKVYFSIKKKR